MRIAYGTDSGVYPHGLNARQFAYMVRYGMTPLAAIRSATIVAAELMGWSDRVGTLAPGRWATWSRSMATRSPTSRSSSDRRPSSRAVASSRSKGLVLGQLQVVEQGGDLPRVRRPVVA